MALACTAVAALSASAVETEQATEPVSATEAVTDVAVEPTDSTAPADEGLTDSYDPNRDVTLTMTACTADHVPISGGGYTIYRVSDDLNVIPTLEEVDTESLGEGIEIPFTDENGKASITLAPEQHGIYLVRNTTIPDTVETGAVDFLISLPYTMNGVQWDYTADASPKLVIKITETEPPSNPTSSKTGGYVTASTADKGAAATGDMQTMTIAIIVGACLISFAVAMLLAARQRKNNKSQ